jgi:uncharacterized protein with HEPN domain
VIDDRLYLIHVSECIAKIERYIAAGRDEFFRDTKTQDAVLRNLQILSESTQRLTNATKSKRSEIDWKGIGAFRNVLTHGYLGVDLNRVWAIVTTDLPVLKLAIESLLNEIARKP